MSNTFPFPSLSDEQRDALIQALLLCSAMQDQGKRNMLVSRLPHDIKQRIERDSSAIFDVAHIVQICEQYPGGLKALIAQVRFFETSSYAMAELDRVLDRYEIAQSLVDSDFTFFQPYISKSLSTKLSKLLYNQPTKFLNSTELLILYAAAAISHDEISQLLKTTTYTDDDIRTYLAYCADKAQASERIKSLQTHFWREVRDVIGALDGFPFNDPEYDDRQLQGQRIRIRLLAALYHLAHSLNLDEHVEPTPPPDLPQRSWEEQVRWWLQAYVCSVSLDHGHVHLTLRIPHHYADTYSLLVKSLNEGLASLIRLYEPVLSAAEIPLSYRECHVQEGNVPFIPADTWILLHDDLMVRQARQKQHRLDQEALHLQQLRDKLVSAEAIEANQYESAEQFEQAANAYAKLAKLLSRWHTPFQAEYYARKAADCYSRVSQHEAAILLHLLAAENLLFSTVNPQLAERCLNDAKKLLVDLKAPSLQSVFVRLQSFLAFVRLDHEKAEKYALQAAEHISQISQTSDRVEQMCCLALQRATIALVVENWELAQHILEDAVGECPETFPKHTVKLLLLLLTVHTARGDWDAEDKIYGQAQAIVASYSEKLASGQIELHYAASLARRGAVQEATNQYRQALKSLEGCEDSFIIAIAHSDMTNMLLSTGAFWFIGDEKFEARRIDLFTTTQTLNKGYPHEVAMREALVKHEIRKAYTHGWIALWHYWRQGWWVAIQEMHGYFADLAMLHTPPQHVNAIDSLIRAGNAKRVEEESTLLAANGTAPMLEQAVTLLLTRWPTLQEQRVALKALTQLTNVIPPPQLEQVVRYIFIVSEQPVTHEGQRMLRSNAFETATRLAPQLSQEQADRFLQLVFARLAKQEWQEDPEALLRLAAHILSYHPGTWSDTEYMDVLICLKYWVENERLRDKALAAAFELVRQGPAVLRNEFVGWLKLPQELEYLALLKEPIPFEQLDARVQGILKAVTFEPIIIQEEGKTVQRIFGIDGSTPKELINFIDVLPETLFPVIVPGLLAGLIHEHNDFSVRQGVVEVLGRLPSSVLQAYASDIWEYLLWGCVGDLPRTDWVSSELAAQTDPFATFRWYTRTVEQVQASSLRVLGHIYGFLNDHQRAQIDTVLIDASRQAKNSMLRRGVAMALREVNGITSIPLRLSLVCIVLLHDADPDVCAWAAWASGNILRQGLAGVCEGDMLERLVQLADPTMHLNVRIGVAQALIMLSEVVPVEQRSRIQSTLELLTNDVSYQVRRVAIHGS